MCGIFGAWNFDGTPLDTEVVLRARDQLRRRGPDDAGVMLNGPVALAHRRLSIIDLSPLGRQPMSNEDGTIWVVFNGEIYNFPQLREELLKRGHRFASQTDTEVIVHGYEEWGSEVFGKLDGMLAIGLWDERRRKMFLSRGPHGKKPLFYHYAAGRRLVFGSTLACLMHWPGLPRELNIPAIHDYIRYGYFYAPQSILRNVQKVRPGHYVEIDQERGLSEHRHWDMVAITHRPRLNFNSEGELLDQLDQRIRAAVRKRLIADVPIGTFLSGGIDSSLIVAITKEVSSQPIKTFSIGFTSAEFDESSHGAAVAAQLGVPNTVFRMSGQTLLEFIPKLTQVYDEPNLDYSILPTMAVARLARSEVTVVLTGDGGDEYFGGYDRYLAMRYFSRYMRFLPRALREVLAERVAPYIPMQRLQRLMQLIGAPDNASFSASYANVSRYFDLEQLLPPGAAALRQGDFVADFIRAQSHLSPAEAAMLFDLTHPMIEGILVKVDRATMNYGVEARSPLLDRDVAEFALQLPLHWKIRGSELKYILKKLLCRYLPPALVYRKKQGFSPPLRDWLRKELRDFLEDHLGEDAVRRRGLFQPAGVRKLINQHQSGEFDHSYLLWAILFLEMWCREYLDTSAPAPMAESDGLILSGMAN
ncbi:MAG: asparagine synthase (glutamine-hydrolyzing) [Pirellulales bacterium]|nr:asparagine synthase (glutamine-hydrolyzing) [Pirellulales bacterium]